MLFNIFSDLGLTGQFAGLGAVSAAVQPYAPLQPAAAGQPAPAATLAAAAAAPGKARSSMNLGMISRR